MPHRQRLTGHWLLLSAVALLGGISFAAWLNHRYQPDGLTQWMLWLGCLSGGTTLMLAGLILELKVFRPLRQLHAQLARLVANPDADAAEAPGGWLDSLTPDLARIHAAWRHDRRQLADAHAAGASESARILGRFETLLQTLNAPVLLCDRHQRLLLFNRAAERLLSPEPALALGKPLHKLLPDRMLNDGLAQLPEDGTTLELLIPHGDLWLRVDICRIDQQQILVTLSDAGPQRSQGAGSMALRPTPEDAIPPRPEFHDFAIADLPPPDAELGHCPLHALEIVAFDTETTGLALREGDGVISLGACRIVNGRIREDGTFDQLIDPERPIPASSTAIHGLTQTDLAGQPRASEVLPRFHAYVGDAVLIAHNASFDMLAIQPHREGPAFDMPVLDTLLLSRALDPGLEGHGLDRLAKRYGLFVPQGARHTALGDARVTAQLWLALLPRLEARGIGSLEEALSFQRRGQSRDDAYAS
ncbi:exonuclease domain-containing protein [Halomonas sp. 18H]|uniref:3'-5' exonuclease n=1 Tax=Halomonas almeriensis TaxID=308163 RepID=UPI002231A2C9|nr:MULTISPECIES: exonuclease domain-containing protein [Halomonas]MCW4153396.1 exonuclease domain-containing protein [Halomonas sp. 18H]MDN3553823.1 exonuclease domain-containing protein [Halomonas almeriensis]